MRARLRHLHPTPPREAPRPRGFALPANDNRRPRRRAAALFFVLAALAVAALWAFGAL